TGAAYLCNRSLSLGNPIVIYVPKSESGRLTSADAEMQQPSDIYTRTAKTLNLRSEWRITQRPTDNDGFLHASFNFSPASHVTFGMQKMAAFDECSAEGNWYERENSN
ncbi:unnamed protein product, partial [Prunus brigantina]